MAKNDNHVNGTNEKKNWGQKYQKTKKQNSGAKEEIREIIQKFVYKIGRGERNKKMIWFKVSQKNSG